MAFVQNTDGTYAKQPKTRQASIGNGDASAWKLLLDMSNTGSGANGSKVTSVRASSSDTTSRVVILAKARSFAGATVTIASPGVVSWSAANGNNLSVADQVIFISNGDTLPTGLSFGTTFFVISAGFSAGVSFQLATSLGGSAINTSGSQSGTHIIAIVRPETAQTVAITSGFDGVTATTNMFGLDSPPIDNDAQNYLYLEANDYLAVSATSTVAANKVMSVTAEMGDF